MKIAILGKGTSAIITALTCMEHGYTVEIYYDPNKPHLNVGESTTPHIAQILRSILRISIGDLIDQNIVSLKYGIVFDGWGVGNSFKHYFNSNSSAFHFESGIFNKFIHDILESRGVKYHAFKIEKYDIDLNSEKVIINNNEYDHLICCSGWDDGDEYKKPIFETVNNAFVYSKECANSQPYTHHLATVDGWQFGLPFPDRNIIKHGYLFNTKFTNIDDAKTNIEGDNIRHISWEPKYCKKMIQNRFCSYNGNRLMFLEPLQALSLYYYKVFADYICLFIKEKRHETFVKYNQYYYSQMFKYQLSLAWHYSYGSKYETPFWQDVKKRSNDFLNMSYFGSKEYYENALHHDKKYDTYEYFNIGCFQYDDYFQVHSGMTGEKLEFKDTYINFF
jgi:tryptophan halogenase